MKRDLLRCLFVLLGSSLTFAPALFAEKGEPIDDCAEHEIPLAEFQSRGHFGGSGAMLRGPANPGDGVIDILVAFTPNAVAALPEKPGGGQYSPREFALAALDTLNMSLEASDVRYNGTNERVRARLVHVVTLTRNETGNDYNDLYQFTFTGDGVWEEAPALRDAYGADLVNLFVAQSNSCGIANTLRVGTEGYPYSLAKVSCVLDRFTFAHEIGHLLGAGHENNPGYYPYSRGYYFAAGGVNYGTVVARQQTGRTRIPLFSSPALTYLNTPIGTASNDNRRTINELANGVTMYRSARCRVDLNMDEVIGVDDIFAFLSAWYTPGSPLANFNGVNGTTVQDLFDFLNDWFRGSCSIE